MGLFDNILGQTPATEPANTSPETITTNDMTLLGWDPSIETPTLSNPTTEGILEMSVAPSIESENLINTSLEESTPSPVITASTLSFREDGTQADPALDASSEVAPMIAMDEVPKQNTISDLASSTTISNEGVLEWENTVAVSDDTTWAIVMESDLTSTDETQVSSEGTSNELMELYNDTPSVSEASQKAPEGIDDFIEASLSKLNEILQSLDTKKQSFLDEEAEYRSQKDHFAELEKTARIQAANVDTERSRLENIKEYFESTKNHDKTDTNQSVNTALTGIWVQHRVTEATTKRPRKSESKKTVRA